jgi:hypothetical protein
MSVNVDLAEYAGRRVTLVFLTGPGPSGNAVYDAALWCGVGIERALGGRTDAEGR